MTKKILSLVLALVLVACTFSFTVSADKEIIIYVEQGEPGKGDGSEENPFGTIEEAIEDLYGLDGTLMIYGEYNLSGFAYEPKWEGMVTLKGATADSVLTIEDGNAAVFFGDITIKDINVNLGQASHFDPVDAKFVYDAGEDTVIEKAYIHCGTYGNRVTEKADYVHESGYISHLAAAGAYVESTSYGVTGDANYTINGGEIFTLSIDAASYLPTQTGITIGGNLNIVQNGGFIRGISYYEQTKPVIMGALQMVFNNGVEIPQLNYPDAAGGVYIVKGSKNGTITPTETAGVFDIQAAEGRVARINGKLVYNGRTRLEPGETEVTFVRGEQKEKTEIKLVIDKAEITTNGVAKALDVPAQIVNSRTLVPLRAIFEALGATVGWDNDTRTVSSEMDGTSIKLTIDDTNLYVNGTAKTLDVPAMIIEGRTMVPARAVAEAYGCDVQWDGETRTVTIVK